MSPVTATAFVPGRADNAPHAVTIDNFTFNPQRLTVSAGSTVTWTNNDTTAHTSTATDGSWNSGTIAPGATFSRAFPARGTFPYHCTIHPGMVGTVTVQ